MGGCVQPEGLCSVRAYIRNQMDLLLVNNILIEWWSNLIRLRYCVVMSYLTSKQRTPNWSQPCWTELKFVFADLTGAKRVWCGAIRLHSSAQDTLSDYTVPKTAKCVFTIIVPWARIPDDLLGVNTSLIPIIGFVVAALDSRTGATGMRVSMWVDLEISHLEGGHQMELKNTRTHFSAYKYIFTHIKVYWVWFRLAKLVQNTYLVASPSQTRDL